ncbi:putative cell-wall binding lipoprotein [Bacillus oleivorans]|uniref:Putative cell-wall binding lipoprotein n=1 Tax=Bacillus oleivorans TaxID=1448271 RepID=A0A285D245_9BACI|nr:YkyA family protein [Bacillus oleivorans]SNX73881.1 putative cell-wall binding lipoprotein [Bacillus oleivorans]
MKKRTKQTLYTVIAAAVFFLAGCTEKVSPMETMYTTLEGVVSAEEGFNEQQDPLRELEKQEHDLFDQIISLSMNEFDQILTLSKEALSIIEQRKEKIEIERQSMIESEEKFKEVQDIIETIEDENLKAQAASLSDVMNTRYQAHKSLYDAYMKGLQLDQELYTILQDENLTLDQLESKINEINEAYELVMEANNQFNEITEKYNDAKKNFYEAAGLEVTVTAGE